MYSTTRGGFEPPEAPEFPLTVPLLPFTRDEVLVPGGVKTLHLYEARYGC